LSKLKIFSPHSVPKGKATGYFNYDKPSKRVSDKKKSRENFSFPGPKVGA
jgi:hypothetical protein